MNAQSLETTKTQNMKDYKAQHKLEDRKKRVQQYKEKYPEMTPMVVQKHPKAKIVSLTRPQFLVNQTVKFSDFKNQIRAKLQLSPQQTLFFYCGNNIISDDISLQELYNKYKDKEDEFLYLNYSDCEVFGN
ncbi:unnamed protein product [Paramecium sonneborni]|uniref:Autophagy-related protein n=1 Tax=Paramecium sonneborni TaxID=65129 RepID=A0A8S1L0D6_9CILI|nr:unnamed protein product [Paramecium sonneborni]